MSRKNIILTDCEPEEILDFLDGLSNISQKKYYICSSLCNQGRSLLNNARRYWIYATHPLKFVFKRRQYDEIIAWQQFFAIFYAFYSRVFHLKKCNTLVAVNFTFKAKSGLMGRMYKKFMYFSINNEYMDYIHVPSNQYADLCAAEFCIERKKFIVTPFGLPDSYDQWKNSKTDEKNYTLAIGRSNRDYDFLIEAWRKMPSAERLIIICDTYKCSSSLPENIIIKNNVTGDSQFPYIANCKIMVIPIRDGNICSGDTVLLKAMSYGKPLVVTVPSTLGEMYIEDGVTGILIKKDFDEFEIKVRRLLQDKNLQEQYSLNARKKYELSFSRKAMGKKLGELIND